MSDLDDIVQALRAERETSPWWTTKAERTEPAPFLFAPRDGSLWDDSETTTARRRRLLDEATRRMHDEEATG